MKDSLFGFKDNLEREEFIIAIPVLLFFAWLGYYLLGDSAPAPQINSGNNGVLASGTDTDGDGVVDSRDRCTLTVGTAANFGCPAKVSFAMQDADGDGVPNRDDNCLHTPGSRAYKGCAATVDADLQKQSVQPAVTDNTGNNTGTDLAAVDTDNDGVNDPADQCPALPGPVDNGGCPLDTDGDTIADADDNCPDVAGAANNNGCPADADADGVTDAEDQCPDLPGVGNPGSAGHGCPPDADGDQVADAADLCPDVPGTIDFNGCPEIADGDGDGIADNEDQCPDVAGDSESNGCPVEADSDGDDIADSIDLCPGRAGEERFQGCPADKDADGVSDIDDRCPDLRGSIDNNGCPADTADSDGDGITDDVDQCPAIAGQSANGCPMDSDGDGVADADDQCNGVVGTVELLGCAPTTDAAASTTISVADQQILDTAVANVEFNSSSATLTSRSKEILGEIASLMKKYPDAYLEISGHTDSSGSARRNMDLSMQRARACAAFIASQGITLERLFAYGYGESQPVTDNSTIAGRKQNRRVEFNLKFP